MDGYAEHDAYRGGVGDDDEGPRPLVIIAALLVGLIVTASLTLLLVRSEAAGQPLLLIVGLPMIGIGIWLILRAVLLRHAPGGWSIAALALLGPTSLAVGLGGLAWEFMQLKRDSVALAEIDRITFAERDPDTPVSLPSADGPVSALARNFYQRVIDDQRGYRQAIAQAKIADLASGAALAAKGSMIDDCSRIDGVRERLKDNGNRHALQLQALRIAARSSAIPARFRSDFARTQGQAADEAAMLARRIEKHESRALDAIVESCTILARRRWTLAGGKIMFHDDAEYRMFDSLQSRIDFSDRQQQNLRQAQADALRRLFPPLT